MVNMEEVDFLMVNCTFKVFFIYQHYIPCTLLYQLSVLKYPSWGYWIFQGPARHAFGSLPLIPSQSNPPRTSCEREITADQQVNVLVWKPIRVVGGEWSVLNWASQPAKHPQDGGHKEPPSFLSPFFPITTSCPFSLGAELAIDQLEPSCCPRPDHWPPKSNPIPYGNWLGAWSLALLGSLHVFIFWGNSYYPLAEPWAGHPRVVSSFVGY